MELNGKIALVTGASRGVGAATAVALARAGCVRRLRGPFDEGCSAADTRHAR